MKTLKTITIATFLLFAIINVQAQAYDHAFKESEGMREVGLDCEQDWLGFYSCEKYGFIEDKTNKVVVPLKYDRVWSFSEGVAKVKLNDKYGFIDKTGKEIIAIKYNEISNFSEDGLAWVRIRIDSYPNSKYGFINKTGKEITAIKYDLLSTFGEGEDGLAMVQLKNKGGFIDKNGNEVIPLQYDGISPFEKGKAQVKLNGRIYYIDKNGNEVK